MIDQLFEHGGIEFLLAQKIDQNSRIDIAAPSTDDPAAGWRQTHAGVDRFSGSDRGHACTIAEMGDHEAVRQIVRKLMHDRFTRKAVKLYKTPARPRWGLCFCVSGGRILSPNVCRVRISHLSAVMSQMGHS